MPAKGDDLEQIAALVDFALFRPELERAVPRADGTKGSRPAFDHVLMFKILLLQAIHGLSDEHCEYLIKDRLPFMRFLGLGLADPVPDANTIWTFREALKRAGAVERLFAQFDTMLRAAGYLAMGGQIVDATIVAAPKQRNTEAERAAIKSGQIPEGWAEKPAKLRQKDRDARWTVKFSKAKPREDGAPQVDLAVPAFGYKNVWPAPSARGFAILPGQSTPTYPVSGRSPGQDGDPRVPVLITMTASSASSCNRFPERRSTVRPSRFHHPQTSSAARAG